MSKLPKVCRRSWNRYEINKPEADPSRQVEIAAVTADIEAIKAKIVEIEKQISQSMQEQSATAQRIFVVDRLLGRLDNLERQISTFKDDSQADLTAVGVSIDEILSVDIKTQPLLDKKMLFADQKKILDTQLDPLNTEGLLQQSQKLEADIDELQKKLDVPHKQYEAYQASLRNWQKQRDMIVGSDATVGTIKYYETRLAVLDAIPQQLSDARKNRLAKAGEIHEVIRQLGDTYRELYAPVHQFIEQRPLARNKFQLNFEVGIVDTGFNEGFFDIISQGLAGTFCGVEPGYKMLREILARHMTSTPKKVRRHFCRRSPSLSSKISVRAANLFA